MKCTLIKRVDNLCIAIGGGILDNISVVLAGSLLAGAIASEYYFWGTQDRPIAERVLVTPPYVDPELLNETEQEVDEYSLDSILNKVP